MTRVLLVTGSRSLANHPGAEAWARGLIRAALVGADMLIVGDAPGPDAWAAAIASSHDVCVRRYDTRGIHAGWIVQQEHAMWCRIDEWATRLDMHPLKRNAAMVRDASAMTGYGATARVLALVDPASETKGTEHTAGLAERAGLTVQREVWR